MSKALLWPELDRQVEPHGVWRHKIHTPKKRARRTLRKEMYSYLLAAGVLVLRRPHYGGPLNLLLFLSSFLWTLIGFSTACSNGRYCLTVTVRTSSTENQLEILRSHKMTVRRWVYTYRHTCRYARIETNEFYQLFRLQTVQNRGFSESFFQLGHY